MYEILSYPETRFRDLNPVDPDTVEFVMELVLEAGLELLIGVFEALL